jgi:hypothetical protein
MEHRPNASPVPAQETKEQHDHTQRFKRDLTSRCNITVTCLIPRHTVLRLRALYLAMQCYIYVTYTARLLLRAFYWIITFAVLTVGLLSDVSPIHLC